MTAPEQLFSAREAARLLGVSRSWFFAALAARDLPPADVLLPGSGEPRKRKRWSAGNLARFIASRRIDRGSTLASL